MGFIPFRCTVCNKSADNIVQDQLEVWNHEGTILIRIDQLGPARPRCSEHTEEPKVTKVYKSPVLYERNKCQGN